MKITPLKIALGVFALLLMTPLAGVGVTLREDGQVIFAWWFLCALMATGAFILHDVITPQHDFREKDAPPHDQMM
ncbi:MAG: hypothetical protein IT379_21630 [Deltaproteobacteria bacterium]|nr:hypothetical protein [Deltaproteobacteria bacterium]